MQDTNQFQTTSIVLEPVNILTFELFFFYKGQTLTTVHLICESFQSFLSNIPGILCISFCNIAASFSNWRFKVTNGILSFTFLN